MDNLLKFSAQTFLFVFMFGLAKEVQTERILLLAHLSGSHIIQIASTGQALLNRGHDVYLIMPRGSRYTPMVESKGLKTLTFDVASMDGLWEARDYNEMIYSVSFDETFDAQIFFDATIKRADTFCDLMLHDTKMMSKVRQLDFKLVVLDMFVLRACLALLPYHLDIPFIGQSDSINLWDIGVPHLPSFMPQTMQEMTDRMTFTERIKSLAAMLYFMSPYTFTEWNTTLLNEFAPKVSSWCDLQKQARLFIIPRDNILEYPTPSMPHVLKTAGISYLPAKPIPSDLSNRVKTAKGIVVISFGSNAGAMPEPYVKTFLKSFSRFPDYAFVWKLPKAEKYTMPNNVIASPWLPQNDLLGHNKTKLFISHCGLNGLYEALYNAIPIVGFPLFAEQHHNSFNIEKRGYGARLNIRTVTPDELVQTMKFVLNDMAIRNRVNTVASILKDRPLPTEQIADFIEHFLKYGDEHLRPASIDMPLYELYMMDILAFLLMLLLVTIFIFYLLAKCMCRILCKPLNDKKQKSD